MIVTSTLLNHLADWLNFIVGHLEDVVNAIQHHIHHLGVLDPKQVAERVDDTLSHHIGHLKGQASSQEQITGHTICKSFASSSVRLAKLFLHREDPRTHPCTCALKCAGMPTAGFHFITAFSAYPVGKQKKIQLAQHYFLTAQLFNRHTKTN